MAFNGNGSLSKRPRIGIRNDIDTFTKHIDEEHHGEESRRKRPENPENVVLLYTIYNAVYPITTEVIHTISSPSGKVLRIVIFKKTGVQAMVEFDSIDSARRAKEALNGADIYSGCCTLKIEYAKPARLNVHRNDMESWDYTLTATGKGDHGPARPPPLLQEPRLGVGPQPYRPGLEGNRAQPQFSGGTAERFDEFHGAGYPEQFPAERFSASHPNERFKGEFTREALLTSTPSVRAASGYPGISNLPAAAAAGAGVGTGPVMMVYGLWDMKRINCDRLFNLFCLYGNVARVKFLKTKEGAAMIQMGDGMAVERCVQHLNNSPLFDPKKRLQLGYSKQAFLSDVPNPYTLPDGSPSFKDYIGNKHNRFINPQMSMKNRIQSPSKILHFFNTPPNITEETLMDLFHKDEIPQPISIKVFPMKSERSSSGLIEFEDIEASIEGLIVLNHAPIENPNGKFPYTMKLCFSSVRQTGMNGSGGRPDKDKDDE